jgi:hypothetical protein
MALHYSFPKPTQTSTELDVTTVLTEAPAIRLASISMDSQKILQLRLNCLLDQLAHSCSQYLRQRIGARFSTFQFNSVTLAYSGVSVRLLDGLAISNQPDTLPFFNSSNSRFGDNPAIRHARVLAIEDLGMKAIYAFEQKTYP